MKFFERHLLLGRKAMTNLDSISKSRDITLSTKVHLVKAMFFPVVMYGCESWTINKAERWRTDAFELWCWRRLFESPLDCKEIQPVHPKGNQSWILIGRTDVEAETPILWPPDVKNWIIGKDPDAGKDWRQEEKGTTEDEMVGWDHQHNGHGFEWTLGVGNGQGGLACCGSWGHKELDTTEQLNWTEAGLVTDRAWAPLWAGKSFPQGQISFSRLNPMRSQGTKSIARIQSDLEGKQLSKGAQAKAGNSRWAVIIFPRTSRLWDMMVSLWHTPDLVPQV